jgi:hypothetical protein
MDRPDFEFRQRKEFFLFFNMSRTSPRLTQFAMQWVWGYTPGGRVHRGGELTTHLYLVTRLRMNGAILLGPRYVFTEWEGTDVLFTKIFVPLPKYFCLVRFYVPYHPNAGHLILYISRTRSQCFGTIYWTTGPWKWGPLGNNHPVVELCFKTLKTRTQSYLNIAEFDTDVNRGIVVSRTWFGRSRYNTTHTLYEH